MALPRTSSARQGPAEDMTTDAPWSSSRWSESYQSQGYFDSPQAPNASAPVGHNSSLQNAMTPDAHSRLWNGQSRGDVEHRELPPLTDAYTDASTYHYWARNQCPSPSIGTYAPPKPTSFPGDRVKEKLTSGAPLTLHIPNQHGRY